MCSCSACLVVSVFFFKQKTAYEMRISDWSSDVCSSDLLPMAPAVGRRCLSSVLQRQPSSSRRKCTGSTSARYQALAIASVIGCVSSPTAATADARSEEHTSELQSLMRNSYAVICMKKKHKHTY